MDTLAQLVLKQKQRGIIANREAVETLVKLTLFWYSEALSDKFVPSNARARVDSLQGRQLAVGALLKQSKHWVSNNVGDMDLKYPQLLMAYSALRGIGKNLSYDDEYKIISSLMRFAFMKNYGLFLNNLQNNPNFIIRPNFVFTNGVFDGDLPVYDRYIMAYLAKPVQNHVIYIASYTDKVFDSFWQDVYGFNPEKRDKFLKNYADNLNKRNPTLRVRPEAVVRLLDGVPLKYEYRLMQNVLRGDYAFCTPFAIQTINKYKDSELLAYRKGARGRKPKTENVFAERMYPRLSQLLESRVDAIQRFEENNKLGITIDYVSPYFVSFSMPRKSTKAARPLINQIHADSLEGLSVRSITSGDLL